jgi:hypothetical protein
MNAPRSLLSIFQKQLRRYQWARKLYLHYRIQQIRLTTKNGNFAVDNFPRVYASRLESISGWYIRDPLVDCHLQVWLGEKPLAGLLTVHRHDVAGAFPNLRGAAVSGFRGDVVIPSDIKVGDKFVLSVRAIQTHGFIVLVE